MAEVMHACTIVARNYLAQAEVLVETFRRHHPEGTFAVLLVDDPRGERPTVPGAEVVLVDEIGVAPGVLEEMCASYQLIELATALKPWMLRSLLDRGYDHAVYFDPDISIERSIDELPGLAADHSIVLTPHLTEPMPRDAGHPSEQGIMLSGTYNLGFIAVGDTPDGRRMLDWWSERLHTDSFIDVGQGFFTDQKSIDMVPGLFQHHIVHDPSWNAAYWNFATRPVARDASGQVTVGGRPPTFFHFSGYSPQLPHLLSKHQGPKPRVLLSDNPVLRELCDDYGARLTAAGFTGRQKDFVAPFRTHEGVTLTPLIRRLIRTNIRDHFTGFDREDGESLAIGGRPGLDLPTWLASPVPHWALGGLGRLLSEIYVLRPDLQAAYPDVPEGDITEFLAWVQAFGTHEMGIPAETVRIERERAAKGGYKPYISYPRRLAGQQHRIHGVEAIGYFTADLGLGETARQFVASLQTAGIPTSTSTYSRTFSRLGVDWTDIPAEGGNRADTLLMCVNADQTPQLVRDAKDRYLARRYRIGLWFWELDDFPASMQESLDEVDEVWVCSEFNAAAIRPHTSKPVTVVPHPAHAPVRSDVRVTEIADPARFTFLFVFDFLSVGERKNPWGLIEAFKRAFPEQGEAQLVIKSINGKRRPADLERLRYAAADRDDVLLIERYLDRAELDGLMWGADCYVSLHRSEGFGQTLAETMAIGKPVIATGYSGNLAFMREDNSYLVRHTLAPVPPGCDPYPPTAVWADPDLDHAAELMREVFEDPVAARDRGEAAATYIAEHFSTASLAEHARTRLEQIWAERDRRKAEREARAARKNARAAKGTTNARPDAKPTGASAGPRDAGAGNRWLSKGRRAR